MVDVFSLAIQLDVLCNQCGILSLIFVEFDAEVSEIKLLFLNTLLSRDKILCNGFWANGCYFFIFFLSITAPQVERKR